MNPLWEKSLQENIFPELEKGRPNYDKPHTIAVVAKIKAIIKASPQLNLDKEVLVIAAYAHDWGYSGLFKMGKPAELTDVLKAKKAHMIIGAKKIGALLKNPEFDFLSSVRKKRIIHLVSVHDKLKQLQDTDELVLMEADTLGSLDTSIVPSTFSKESNDRFLQGVMHRRAPKFLTNYSKRQLPKLLNMRRKQYSE